jgi:hypothetical protein
MTGRRKINNKGNNKGLKKKIRENFGSHSKGSSSKTHWPIKMMKTNWLPTTQRKNKRTTESIPMKKCQGSYQMMMPT